MPPVSLRASTAEKVERVDAALRLDRGGLDRLARLGGDRQRQLVDPLADQLGGAVEDLGARVLGEVGGLEGLVGGPRRAVDERRVALGDPADRGAVVGAPHLVPLAGLDPLAGGEELVIDCLDCLRRHARSPLSVRFSQTRAGRDSPIAESVRARMRIRLTAMLFFALLAAAAAPSAQAGVSWVVRGHGFGHGVGMSQYGAYGYAEHGKGYRFILGHYYRGTTLGDAAGPADRPRPGRRSSAATSASAARPAPAAGALDRGREYEAHRGGAAGQAAQRRGPAARRLRAASCARPAAGGSRSPASAPTAARSRSCRPTRDAGSLNAINALPVDQYVKGVIPNESPASWPQAALRAQAVAARSYALTVQVSGNGFDLYDDTSSQVYEGLDSETAATNQAARSDQGRGRHLRRQDRRNLLLRLLGRPHRERPERLLRPAGPLPGRRPRPLRLLLPAAQLDAEVQRAGDQRQARRLPRRAAEEGRQSPSAAPRRGSSGRASTEPAA